MFRRLRSLMAEAIMRVQVRASPRLAAKWMGVRPFCGEGAG